ncbi:MAG: M23 family metallopeptidase [Idiomarina sp.]|nr:M23 family metallopeptidase [Idiomarina sp.]
MSLSIIYRGRKIKFGFQFTPVRLLSLAALSSFLLVSYHQPWGYDGMDSRLAQARITDEQRELAMQSEAVQQVRRKAEQELTAMTMKVGEIQAQLLRLEALGQRLTEVAQLDPAEFNFAQPMPVGGPDIAVNEWPTVSDHALLQDLDSMLGELADKQKQLRILESVMVNHHMNDERRVAGRPVVTGWPSSSYGVRKDPFNGNPRMHRGLDFAGTEGDPVVATGAGIVTYAGRRGGYGNFIEIDHGTGIRTRYAHMQRIDVSVGDVVTRGQHIATVGSTGRSTGPHVHYEILENGRHVNPSAYVQRQVAE